MLQIQKAQELDVVKLIEDLPQYELSKGAQGTVVEVFDKPEEGYMVEFIDDASGDSKIADWVLPSQIENIDQKAEVLFRKGILLMNNRESLQAAQVLREALALKPTLIRTLHNMISELTKEQDWPKLMAGMRFIIDLDPTYQLAWTNLAVAYLNYGVEKARENNLAESLTFFLSAFRIDTPPALQDLTRRNIAAAHVHLGISAHKKGVFETALTHMQAAYIVISNPQTRLNMALAYSILADKLLQMGVYQTAISNYTAAEEAGMLTSEGLNNRAVAHIHTMQVDEAIEALQTAIAIDPDNSVARDNLTLLKQNLPHIKAAVMESLRTKQIYMEFKPLPPPEPVPMSTVHT